MYELSRAIGYDATAYTGSVLGYYEGGAVDVYGNPLRIPRGHTPHGWVEINFDGESLILDPEFEFRMIQQHRPREFFKVDAQGRRRYGYTMETADTPAATAEPAGQPSPTPVPTATPGPT